MDVRIGLQRKLSAEERILLNCGAEEDSWESLGLQWDPTSLSSRKSVLNIQWKDWCWSWIPILLATWFEELTHLKRPWCWERLKSGGEGGDRGWDGWMASPIRWTWVWVSSASWWWTRRLGMLQSMGLQRVPQAWMTELTDLVSSLFYWPPEEMTVTFSNLHLNSQRLQFLPFNFGGVCIFLLIFNIFAIEIFPHSSSLLTNFNILEMYTCVET